MPVNDDWTIGDDIRVGTTGDDIFEYFSKTGFDEFHGGIGHDGIVLQDNYFTDVSLTLQIGFMSSIEYVSNLDYSPANIEVKGMADFRNVSFTGKWTGNITGSDEVDIIYLGTFPGSETGNVVTLDAGAGNDMIFGSTLENADVTIHGGVGNDTIQAVPRSTSTWSAEYKFYGDAGNDTIIGWEDSDYINGGTGDDHIMGLGGKDTLIGGAGSDNFYVNWYTNDWNTYIGGDGVIADSAVNRIIIENGEGWSPSMNKVYIESWSDIDQVLNNSDGGATLYFRGSFDLSSVALKDITGAVGGSGNDTIIGNVSYDTSLGGNRGILLDGQGGDDTIIGSVLGDVINGGAGNDIIQGRGGDDVITGGSGTDWFWFETNNGVDTIADFTVGEDKLVVGSSLSSINLYYYDGGASTLVEFDGGSTYAILTGVDPTLITGSDFLWA